MDQIGLTEEQLDAMAELRQEAMDAIRAAESRSRSRHRDGNCMDQLDLDEDQIAEMDAIRQAAMDAIREAERPVHASDIFEDMQQAIEEVMTEEQLLAYRDCIRPRLRLNCMDTIGLTEQQIADMQALREAAIADLQEAQGQEEVRAIMDQLFEDMMGLLTDEQVAALEECRDGQRRGQGT